MSLTSLSHTMHIADSEAMAWCYTLSPVRWQFCSVDCKSKGEEFLNTTAPFRAGYVVERALVPDGGCSGPSSNASSPGSPCDVDTFIAAAQQGDIHVQAQNDIFVGFEWAVNSLLLLILLVGPFVFVMFSARGGLRRRASRIKHVGLSPGSAGTSHSLTLVVNVMMCVAVTLFLSFLSSWLVLRQDSESLAPGIILSGSALMCFVMATRTLQCAFGPAEEIKNAPAVESRGLVAKLKHIYKRFDRLLVSHFVLKQLVLEGVEVVLQCISLDDLSTHVHVKVVIVYGTLIALNVAVSPALLLLQSSRASIIFDSCLDAACKWDRGSEALFGSVP